MSRQNAYFPCFDWLRGVLSLTVVLSHEGILTWHHAGSFAVQVFFALSGWLIGGILLRTSIHDLPRFYWNRAFRIWVPYYIALALLIAAALLHDNVTPKWIEIIIYKFTFVYNLFGTPQIDALGQLFPLQGTGNHFWSVNAEEQFYLLAPLLLVLANRKIGQSTITWILIAVAACYSSIYASIVFGVLAALFVHNHGAFHTDHRVRAGLLAVTAGSFWGILAGYDYELLVPFCSVAIVLLLAVEGRQGFLGSLVGGMSYELYLNHWIGVFIAHAAVKRIGISHQYLVHFFSVPFGVALAIGMYWTIDRKLHTLRGLWFAKNRGIAVIVVGYGMCMVGCAYHFAVFSRN
jgi:peptidoglycan/LPS O-acetylase OafA/YrhL